MKKKGRTVTLGISANINDYDRDGLRYSRTDYINTSRKPSVTDEYYIQDDKTVTYGLNLSYVEPLTKNNFLQVKYSLQSQNSETDKITYKKADADSSLYDVVVPNSTRKVDNIFVTQSMQVNFKRTLKKYNFIAGLTAQQSSTKTSVTLPNSAEKENPKKNITNISPNFEFNYKWSKRHNLRLQYTTRIRPASSLQLYDGVISQSTTDSLRGNPNLQPRFVGTGTLRYQNYNSKKASMLIIESGVTHIKNDIVIATTWEGTKRSRIYENINGNMDGNLQVIYNTPLRNKKLSFNSNSLIRYNIQNTFVNPDSSATLLQNKSKILTFREITGLRYNSDLFDFDVRGSVSYNNVKNNIVSNNNRNTLNFGGYASCYFYLPHNMILSTDLTFTANAGYSSEYQQEEWLWNIMVAKEIFKKKNGIIRLLSLIHI